jgi:hypothetical protein
MKGSKLQSVIDVFRYWLRPKFVFGREKIELDPNLKGLFIGKKGVLLPWEKIIELRSYRDVIEGGVSENWYGHHRIKTITGNWIWFNVLSDSMEKEIINQAKLGKKNVSFWTSENVYAR